MAFRNRFGLRRRILSGCRAHERRLCICLCHAESDGDLACPRRRIFPVSFLFRSAYAPAVPPGTDVSSFPDGVKRRGLPGPCNSVHRSGKCDCHGLTGTNSVPSVTSGSGNSGKTKTAPNGSAQNNTTVFLDPDPASTQCVGSRRTGMLDIDLQRRTYSRRGYHPYLHVFRASEVREDLMGTNVGVPRTPTKASRPCDSARELGRSQCKAIWLDDWRRRNSALGSLPFQCFRRSAR